MRILRLCLLLCLLAGWAFAQDNKPDAVGPKQVKLAKNLGTLDLPKGFGFYDQARARSIMEAQSGGKRDDVIGFIIPMDEKAEFAILLEYEETGYVKDDDAGKIDAKKILESYQEGTEAQNEERKKLGREAIHVTGWEQEPKYESKSHIVTWSLQGETDKKEPFVNFNTRLLTRRGVLSFNLMCDNKGLAVAREQSSAVLKGIAFAQGERYEDFKEGDKVSTLGLVGLIAGGALLAKKTGLIAMVFMLFKPLILLLKAGGAKLIGLVVVVLGSLGSSLLSKKKSAEEPPPPSE
jgi:uncharacterized membrane-anchored protein